MNQNEIQKWDDRYRDSEYAFGKAPNLFFEEWLRKLTPGSILLPAEGEGRNGVFAATLGWKVTAFDLSSEGKSKAIQLAEENDVSLQYIVGDFEHLDFDTEAFDVIGLVYAHFPPDKRHTFHKKLTQYLKPGGVIILEAFSKEHLPYRNSNPSVGGPTDINALYSEEEVIDDFSDFQVMHLSQEEITLNEGKFHIGEGSVIRYVGKKGG